MSDFTAALPTLPNYDPVANSGWLGAQKLLAALRPGLTVAQLVLAGEVLEDLQVRQRIANANALAACGPFEVSGEVLLISSLPSHADAA